MGTGIVAAGRLGMAAEAGVSDGGHSDIRVVETRQLLFDSAGVI